MVNEEGDLLEVWRDRYNRGVTALASEMAKVSAHLVALSEMRGELSQAVGRGRTALYIVEQRIAQWPPAMPIGTAIPLDIYFQGFRPEWAALRTSFLHGVDVVLAHYIPQSKRQDILFNQITPTRFLGSLGSPIQSKNGALLYTLPYRHVSRDLRIWKGC